MTSHQASTAQQETAATLWRDPNVDYRLEDMLADPVIQLVMKRDGVSRADVEQVVYQTRARLMAAQGYFSAQAAA